MDSSQQEGSDEMGATFAYRVHKWGVRDWRVMRKPLTSTISHTVSQHTTKGAAYAALRRIDNA